MDANDSNPNDVIGTTAGRPIKRSERALSQEAAFEIIKATDHAVISTSDSAGVPYGIPITPVLIDDAIYFHCSLNGGRRTDNLRTNPRCSICFIGKSFTLGEFYSVDYAAAVVDGMAEEVLDENLKKQVVLKLIERHAPQTPKEKVEETLNFDKAPVAIWRINIKSVSAKARAAKLWHGPSSLKEIQTL